MAKKQIIISPVFITVGFKNIKDKPYLGQLDGSDAYYMVINPKRDLRNLKKLQKIAKKKIESYEPTLENIRTHFMIYGWLKN